MNKTKCPHCGDQRPPIIDQKCRECGDYMYKSPGDPIATQVSFKCDISVTESVVFKNGELHNEITFDEVRANARK